MQYRQNPTTRGSISPSHNSNNSYLLNIAAVEIPNIIIKAGKTPIASPDHIKILRQKHPDTHVFIRRDEAIIDIPVTKEAQQTIGTPTDISLPDDLGIASNLVNEGLIRHLAAHGRKFTNLNPISFLSESPNDNFLALSVPSNTPCPNWLAVYARPEFSVRALRFSNRDQIVAMIFNLWSANVISANCETLNQLGVDLIGKYIAEAQPLTNPRFRIKNEVIGRVSEIKNGELLLEDPKYSDKRSIPLEHAYIEPRFGNIEHCIDVIFGPGAKKIKETLNVKLTELRSGPGRLIKIQSHASYLAKVKIEILPGIQVTIGPLIDQQQGRLFPKVEAVPKPTYVFDPTRQRTHQLHDKGLDLHGPYDQATFNAPTPRVAIICQDSKKGRVEQFLRNFWDGMPTVTTKRGVAPYEKGFLRKYCTNKWEVDFFVTSGPTATAYNKSVQEALEKAGTGGRRWNLAMVQIEENFRDLPAAQNPYLTTKAAFLSQGVPSQEFKIETISKTGTQLAYALNQMALATYAKLGGIPWLLAATPSVAHELIFGLGSASVGGGRFETQERVVGITTVFKGDGDYILENRSKAVRFDEYPDQILTSLRSTIDILRQRYNWQNGESVRLIFHAFKPLKNVEVDAVKILMSEIAQDFNVEYAFIHVVESHPFLLIDKNQQGVRDFETGKTKGTFSATRGQVIQINRHEALLNLTGAAEVKKAEDGLPTPVLLKLHKGSTFVDMTYLARQVYSLSCHSWRTFMPCSMPITVTYSDLIARQLGNFSLLPKWNPDTMLGPIGSSRWFL